MGCVQELYTTSEFLSKILHLTCYIPIVCPFCLPLKCEDGDLSHPQGSACLSQCRGYREHPLCLAFTWVLGTHPFLIEPRPWPCATF